VNKPEDIAKFIQSLNPEQMQNFQKMFNIMAEQAGVEVPEPVENPERKTPRELMNEYNEEQKRQSAVVVNEDFTVTRENKLSRKKRTVKAGKNKWTDDGTASPHDPEFDPKKFESIGRASRRRTHTKKVEKTCHVCGKRFKINPNLVYGENIRCDRCVGR
jgi:hypothetical protein